MDIDLVDVTDTPTIEQRARAFLGDRPAGVPESTYLSAILQIVNIAEQLEDLRKKVVEADAAPPAAETPTPPADVPPARDPGAYL